MNVGDIVRFDGKLWRVETHDRTARLCKLRAWEGDLVEVPDDLEEGESEPRELSVYARPSEEWPFAAAPNRTGWGPVLQVFWNTKFLTPLQDWAPSSKLRQGGSLFFNPSLGLRRGDVILAVHKGGKKSRVNITAGFGTIKARKAGRKPLKPRRANRASALIDNDPFEGSDL